MSRVVVHYCLHRFSRTSYCRATAASSLRARRRDEAAVDKAQHSLSGRGNTFFLDLQIYFIALFTAVMISSTLVYYLEHEQPDTLFVDIPAALWWGIVTITTTGYGDMVPATLGGRLLAGGTMLTGLALFGILTSVIGRFMLASLFGTSDESEDEGGSPGEADGTMDERLPASGADGSDGAGGRDQEELIAGLQQEIEGLRRALAQSGGAAP